MGPHMEQTRFTRMKANWKSLYTIGGTAALLQLAAVLVAIVAAASLGPRPETVQEAFAAYQASKLAGVLRDDFTSLAMIALYLGTFPALYLALRRVNAACTALATLFIFVGVTICFAIHSGFSLMALSDRYAAATTEAQRGQLLAAGDAILASNLWISSGGYMAGILLQGAGVMISLVMLRSREFSKVTACSGLLANAIDLTQHLLHPFAPSISAALIPVMGPFYLLWFPMLARDLFRLGADPGNSVDL